MRRGRLRGQVNAETPEENPGPGLRRGCWEGIKSVGEASLRGCKGKLPTGRGRPHFRENGLKKQEGAEGLPGSQVDKTWQESFNRWGRLEEEDRGLRLGCLCYQSKRQTGDTHRGEISYNPTILLPGTRPDSRAAKR